MDVKSENKETDTEYQFIQEQVVPNKKKKLKRVTIYLAAVLGGAIIFGLVSRCVYFASTPWFENLSKQKSQQTEIPLTPDISFPTIEPTEPEKEGTEEEEVSTELLNQTDCQAEFTEETVAQAYTLLKQKAEQVNKSIVSVVSVVNNVDWFENEYATEKVVSGLVLIKNRAKIYILVSYDRIKDVDDIKIAFSNNMRIDATVQNVDADINLAVLTVNSNELSESTYENVKEATLGESYTIAVGDPVLALGSPNGYMNSMMFGIITNKQNYAYITDNRLELFNTDIANYSDGEGIVVNLKGEVIGIMTNHFKTATKEDMNTVIAISKVKPAFENLVNNSKKVYFGIIGTEIPADVLSGMGITYGIYVSEVKSKSPAAKVGIKTGDIIQSVDGTEVTSLSRFNGIVTGRVVGEKVPVTIYRYLQKKWVKEELDVTLDEK